MSDNYDFVALTCRHGRGELRDQIAEMLRDVVREVTRYGGKGDVTLKMQVRGGADGQVTITPVVSSNTPKREAGDAHYWVGDDGDLFTRPPKLEADDGVLRPVKNTQP